MFKKGKSPWNKGKKVSFISSRFKGKHHTEKTKQEMREKFSGDKSPCWKGENVGYGKLHGWVVKKLGKPNHCEFCKRTDKKRYEWSNKDHKYRRNLEDWQRLCQSCHRLYDIKVHNGGKNYNWNFYKKFNKSN